MLKRDDAFGCKIRHKTNADTQTDPTKLCGPINQDNDANEHGKGIMKTLEYARIISQFSVKGRPL